MCLLSPFIVIRIRFLTMPAMHASRGPSRGAPGNATNASRAYDRTRHISRCHWVDREGSPVDIIDDERLNDDRRIDDDDVSMGVVVYSCRLDQVAQGHERNDHSGRQPPP